MYAIQCQIVSLYPKGVNSHNDPLEFTRCVQLNFLHKASHKSLTDSIRLLRITLGHDWRHVRDFDILQTTIGFLRARISEVPW